MSTQSEDITKGDGLSRQMRSYYRQKIKDIEGTVKNYKLDPILKFLSSGSEGGVVIIKIKNNDDDIKEFLRLMNQVINNQ